MEMGHRNVAAAFLATGRDPGGTDRPSKAGRIFG